jgi:hypothetical protein
LKEAWNGFWGFVWKELVEALVTPSGGAGVLEELGSGYSVEADTHARVSKLLALQEEAVANPSWQPAGGKTFCNRAVAFVAQGMGYFFPATELADEMIAAMASDPRWTEDSLDRAAAHALKGGLAVAALEENPHGHVCTFAPLPKEISGTWGCQVPMVANVGKTNGIMRISGAFEAADRSRLRFFLLAMEDA